MNRYNLKRISYLPDCTFGVLIDMATGRPLCATLENPYRFNEPNKSCIPSGAYYVDRYTSDKYKNVFEVLNVHERSKILIHSGNTADDTQGCILPGMSYGMLRDKPAVLQSRSALDILREHIRNKSILLID